MYDVTKEEEIPRQSVAAGYECSNATVETDTALARALQQNTKAVLSRVSRFDPQQDLQTTLDALRYRRPRLHYRPFSGFLPVITESEPIVHPLCAELLKTKR